MVAVSIWDKILQQIVIFFLKSETLHYQLYLYNIKEDTPYTLTMHLPKITLLENAPICLNRAIAQIVQKARFSHNCSAVRIGMAKNLGQMTRKKAERPPYDDASKERPPIRWANCGLTMIALSFLFFFLPLLRPTPCRVSSPPQQLGQTMTMPNGHFS